MKHSAFAILSVFSLSETSTIVGIEFEALNEGLSSPNTAELKVYDEHDVLISSNRWLITTGYKARLMISKQEN